LPSTNNVTQEWWQLRRDTFELYVSELVIQEASAGDKTAAEQRLQALEGIPALRLSEEMVVLAEKLIYTLPKAKPRHIMVGA
jgi:hypothetical protein